MGSHARPLKSAISSMVFYFFDLYDKHDVTFLSDFFQHGKGGDRRVGVSGCPSPEMDNS